MAYMAAQLSPLWKLTYRGLYWSTPAPRMQWITHVGGTVVCTVAESRVVLKAGEVGETEDQSPEIQ